MDKIEVTEMKKEFVDQLTELHTFLTRFFENNATGKETTVEEDERLRQLYKYFQLNT
jgi:hypothetical protein